MTQPAELSAHRGSSFPFSFLSRLNIYFPPSPSIAEDFCYGGATARRQLYEINAARARLPLLFLHSRMRESRVTRIPASFVFRRIKKSSIRDSSHFFRATCSPHFIASHGYLNSARYRWSIDLSLGDKRLPQNA